MIKIKYNLLSRMWKCEDKKSKEFKLRGALMDCKEERKSFFSLAQIESIRKSEEEMKKKEKTIKLNAASMENFTYQSV
jgi:hypothetical protein